jgi:hypothetical protein
MSRPVRSSALKARERIASYYGVSVSSDRVSSDKASSNNPVLTSDVLLLCRLSDLLKSIDCPTENHSRIQHRLEVANEIYTMLLSNTDFLLKRNGLCNAILQTMERNEDELTDIMNKMFETKHSNLSLLGSFEKTVHNFHHNEYKSSILTDLSAIKNKMDQYEQYIITIDQSIIKKIKILREILNKNK